jgi:ketosteroid isomerase-like protein
LTEAGLAPLCLAKEARRKMRSISFWKVAVFTAVCLTFSNTAQAAGKNEMTKDQQDVMTVIQKMTSSFEAGDIDAVMQTYEPNQSIAFEPGQTVSDEAVARQIFTQFNAMSPTFSYSGHEVIVEGDIAVHIAPWKMNGTGPDGKVVEGAGLSIAVLRRQADGNWKMVIDNPHGSRLLADAAR